MTVTYGCCSWSLPFFFFLNRWIFHHRLLQEGIHFYHDKSINIRAARSSRRVGACALDFTHFDCNYHFGNAFTHINGGGFARVRRVGNAIPYSYFNANEFYRVNIKQPWLDGCTPVFATPKAAWSTLILSFAYLYFEKPVQLCDVDLDQLHTQDGGVIRSWLASSEDRVWRINYM
jgi:hypothetical protein